MIKDASGQTWGFDYGLSVQAIALGSFDFNQKLRDAEVIGVAYGMDYSVELGCAVPTLTLVGRNEERFNNQSYYLTFLLEQRKVYKPSLL